MRLLVYGKTRINSQRTQQEKPRIGHLLPSALHGSFSDSRNPTLHYSKAGLSTSNAGLTNILFLDKFRAELGQHSFGGARASGTRDRAGSMLNLLFWYLRALSKKHVGRRQIIVIPSYWSSGPPFRSGVRMFRVLMISVIIRMINCHGVRNYTDAKTVKFLVEPTEI